MLLIALMRFTCCSREVLQLFMTEVVALTDSYQNVKGPVFLKMNVSLLEDETYFNDFKIKLPQWKTMGTNNLSDKHSVWDWVKYNIRNHGNGKIYGNCP